MKIVLPVAGRGGRFEPLTDWLPKCLAPVRQRPLLWWAVRGLKYKPNDLVIIANERERHILDPAFDAIFDRKVIRVWTQDTGGASQTVLKAREFFDNREPLLIVTPDMVWYADLDAFREQSADAGLVVTSAHRQEPVEWQRGYSYCALGESGKVTKVIEKPVVPLQYANIGVYWWSEGRRFARYADFYLQRGETVNGERYIAPIYNAAIEHDERVCIVEATEYVNLGSAERAAKWEGWGLKPNNNKQERADVDNSAQG